jgi:tetratricopeptide (TPR) repeat protein
LKICLKIWILVDIETGRDIMKKVVCLFLLALSPAFLFGVKTKILDVQTGVPVVISLANKHDGGEWVLESKPDTLMVKNKRKGYLYTYFIFISEKTIQGPLVFEYRNGKEKEKQTYFIRVKEGQKSDQKAMDARELVMVSENNKDKAMIKIPENVQLYITNLAEEGLYREALEEINRLLESTEEKKAPFVEPDWLIKKKIEILEKQKKYDEVASYANSLLEEGKEGEKKLDSEKEFFLRLSKAKADYRAGKKREAHGQLIFLKNYYPDNALAYYELGMFYFEEGEIQKGVTLFEYLVSRFSEIPARDDVYYRLARYYYQVVGLNGYNLSYKYYRKIVQLGVISPHYQKAKRMTEFLEENFINIR